MLFRSKEAFDGRADLENLLLAPYFRDAVTRAQPAWRAVVAAANVAGIPVPAFGTALAYYDGYRRERLPANLLQAQRDYFGAHTYQRTDDPAAFHTEWLERRRPPRRSAAPSRRSPSRSCSGDGTAGRPSSSSRAATTA